MKIKKKYLKLLLFVISLLAAYKEIGAFANCNVSNNSLENKSSCKRKTYIKIPTTLEVVFQPNMQFKIVLLDCDCWFNMDSLQENYLDNTSGVINGEAYEAFHMIGSDVYAKNMKILDMALKKYDDAIVQYGSKGVLEIMQQNGIKVEREAYYIAIKKKYVVYIKKSNRVCMI